MEGSEEREGAGQARAQPERRQEMRVKEWNCGEESLFWNSNC